MKAIVLDGAGDVSVLKLRDGVAQPVRGPGDVLVRVHATAINRADILQRLGKYPAPPGVPADIPGMEYAGVVEQAGAAVRDFRPGDRVFGLVAGGSYAQYISAHERTVAHIPADMTFESAAAVPEAFITAHDAMFRLGGFSAGAVLLVQAAGSGVGIAAVQLAKATGGLCIGTSRTPEKLERIREHGCDLALLDDADTLARVLDYTEQRGVDLIFEFTGPGKLDTDLKMLRTGGRIIQIGLMGGASAQVNFALLTGKRATVIGTTLRNRPLEEKIAANQAFVRGVLPLLGSKLRPVIDSVFDLADIAQAHTRMERNENFGKIVVRVP